MAQFIAIFDAQRSHPSIVSFTNLRILPWSLAGYSTKFRRRESTSKILTADAEHLIQQSKIGIITTVRLTRSGLKDQVEKQKETGESTRS